MSPRLNRRCTTCGRKLAAGEVGAEVETPLNRWWWCLTCWDTDGAALGQYQLAGSVTAMRWSAPKAEA